MLPSESAPTSQQNIVLFFFKYISSVMSTTLFHNIFFRLNSSAALMISNFPDFNFAKSDNKGKQNSSSSSLYACKDVYRKSKAKRIIFYEYGGCLLGLYCFRFVIQTIRNSHQQWWILGEANEAVASGPPFFWGPPSKTAYAVLDSLQMFAQRTIRSEDLFFFF